VMNQFFKDGKEGIFTWSVEVQIAPKRKKSKPNGNSEISWISSKLSFTAEKDSEKIWKTDSTHIEAVLSLWLYRTNKQIRNHTSEVKKDEKNVDWLRSTKSGVTGSFYRVLGPDTKTLRNDMAWWTGDYTNLPLNKSIVYDKDKFNLIAGFVGFRNGKFDKLNHAL